MARKRSAFGTVSTGLRRGAVAGGALLLVLGMVSLIRDTSPRVPPAPAPLRLALPQPPAPKPPPPEEAAPTVVALPAVAPVPAVAPPPAAAVAPWRQHAVAAPPFDGRPLIAIVIDDLGVDRRRSARTVALPKPLTLAWLPYAADVGHQAAAARAAGHEILLHAPMQPQGQENPGPNALLSGLPPDEIRKRLGNALALLPDAVGLNNHMGSRFTREPEGMSIVIAELKARGLLFLDSRTSMGSVAAGLARDAGVPNAVRDVFLDNEPNYDYVRVRLAELESVARRRGYAVAIGHPHDATLDALEAWLPQLAARGFVLAPVSAIVRYTMERPAPLAVRH